MTNQVGIYRGYRDNFYMFEVNEKLEKYVVANQEVKNILSKVTEDEFNNSSALFKLITNKGNNGQIFLNEIIIYNQKIQKTLNIPNEKEIKKVKNEKSNFEILYDKCCKTFKKDNFNYISWATCWKEIKLHDPNATFKTYYAEDGYPAWIKKKIGTFVKVGVTIDNIEYIEFYPVTNTNNHAMLEYEYDKEYKNKGGAVTSTFHVDKISSFDINCAIKRALVKACSYAGFGLKLYNKEEMTEEEE